MFKSQNNNSIISTLCKTFIIQFKKVTVFYHSTKFIAFFLALESKIAPI